MNMQPCLCLCCSHATKSGFLATCPPVMSKCIFCYKCVSDKKKVKFKKLCMLIYMIYVCCNMSVHVVLVMLGLP